MNEWIKQLFSLTISGTLLIFVLLLLKKLYKKRFSKCWQYYIWLAVMLRFLIPFAPDIRIARTLLQTVEQPEKSVMNDIFSTGFKSDAQDTYISCTQPDSSELLTDKDLPDNDAQAYKTDAAGELVSVDFEKASVLLFFIWLVPALVILLRKVLAYRKFMRYIRTKGAEVSDLKILNILAVCEEKCSIRKPVELYYRPLLPTPVMTGFLHPYMVIPDTNLTDEELSFIFTHELVHLKRLDMFYKWLVQIVVCVHWFNPFVYVLQKEVNYACELACDEAVVGCLNMAEKKAYGDTLLLCSKTAAAFKHTVSSLALTEGAEQLKERLGEIMNDKKRTKKTKILTAALTVCIFTGSAAVGAHIAPAYAAQPQSFANISALAELQANLMKGMLTNGQTDKEHTVTSGSKFSKYQELLAFRTDSYRNLTVAQFREKVTLALDTPKGIRLLDEMLKDEEVHRHLFDNEDAFFLKNTLYLANGSWRKNNLSAVGVERPLKNGQTASLDFRAQIRLLNADIKVSEYEAAYRELADAAMEFLTSKTDAELSDTSAESTKRISKEALMAMQKYAKRICKKGNINLTVNWCSYFPEGDILDIPNKVTPGGTTKRDQLPEKIKKILTIKVKDYKNDTLSDFLDYTAQRYEADNSLWKASQGYWTLLDEKTIQNLSREDYEFLTVTLPCTASESTYPSDRASRFPAGFGSSFDLAYPKRGTNLHFEWYVNYEIKNPKLTVGQRDQLILNVTYGMDDFLQNTPKTTDIGSEEYLKEMSSCLERLAKENSKAGLEMTVFQCQRG